MSRSGTIIKRLQGYADVITQKSLAEGRGAVAGAMWKGRPVIGAAVDCIEDQITDGQAAS